MPVPLESTIRELKSDYGFSDAMFQRMDEAIERIAGAYEAHFSSRGRINKPELLQALYNSYYNEVAEQCFRIKVAFMRGERDDEDYSSVVVMPDEQFLQWAVERSTI